MTSSGDIFTIFLSKKNLWIFDLKCYLDTSVALKLHEIAKKSYFQTEISIYLNTFSWLKATF